MSYSNKSLILNIIATLSSVLFLECLFVNSRVSGGINWEMVVFDSITGIGSYVIFLILLDRQSKFAEIPTTICSLILGSVVWISFHMAYLFYFDCQYLSNVRPEKFWQRNIEESGQLFLYLLPVAMLSALIFTTTLQVAKKAAIYFIEKADSLNNLE